MKQTYRVSIGLEVHIQLKTQTKLFCGCATSFGAPPNSCVCPVCLGYPGAMPVMNREAVRLTLVSGLMLGCSINTTSTFDRKSYFYPDMPKNYQITQYDKPLCLDGTIDIPLTDGGRKPIRLIRIHLEEDVAKSMHEAGWSGVDFNRAGTPLMEIVTHPDLSSADEAAAFLTALRQILLYVGVSACNLEEGNMRCDVNVSLRPPGQDTLGTKVELKNMNTISGTHDALQYEIERQSAVLDAGGRIVQETRRWDVDNGVTIHMRSKEDAHDYRYFAEPDLLPIVTPPDQIDAWRRSLPELPAVRRERLARQYDIPDYDAAVLAADRALADFFEAVAQRCGTGKTASNWIMTDVLRLVTAHETPVTACALTPDALGELIGLVEAQTINALTAKELLEEVFLSGGSPAEQVRSRGLAQVSDSGALDGWIDAVMQAHPKSVADWKAGKQAAAGFLIGQVMKASQGKADPKRVGRLLGERLAQQNG
ncbi:MAG: Asp-tRNA(Asn)/Glu-tRNA(Gln) amidotransferase subunit GatB [Lentisphaerae bacterium]|nr:Asp-tRNA(Asn)/Glu-tRNA(Gln) amidotransferase subunit GatB [Lentisphaerota bacterium]